MVEKITRFVEEYDPEIGGLINKELARQRGTIELIASENIVSPAVMAAMGTCLTNKYAEGLPGARYYGGCEVVDEVERIAIARAKELFGAEHANVQPHSGASANLAALVALIKPGDTILSMDLSNGGHLSHGSPVNISGMYFKVVSYGVNAETGRIDYDEVERLARDCRPRLIIAGASAYPRAIDFKRFSEIAREAGAYLMVDMAHIAGLVAAGEHMSPVPYADVVTTTTHKTLRGPRGGLILCRRELGKAVDKAVFPGTQGGPLMHVIASKAICFAEALKPEFKTYQHQIILNARRLADALMERGLPLVSGGTDNHLMLANLVPTGKTGKEVQMKLDEVHITVNKNSIPNDPARASVTSGIRIGVPAVTSRGFREPEMDKIAELLMLGITDFDAQADHIRSEVAALCERFPLYN